MDTGPRSAKKKKEEEDDDKKARNNFTFLTAPSIEHFKLSNLTKAL